MDTRARAEQIRSEVRRALTGSGLELDEVTIHRAGRRSQLRVTVARDVTDLLTGDTSSPVQPLSLDEIAAAARDIDGAVEAGDLMGSAPFTLEVSSPGIDRPLDTPAQFRRNIGRLVDLVLTDGREVTGRLVSAGVHGVEVGGTERMTLAVEQIGSATVRVEFTHREGDT